MKPFYIQQMDCEPEFLGFYESYEFVLNDAVDKGWSNQIGRNTTIAEITFSMLADFKDDDRFDELVLHFSVRYSEMADLVAKYKLLLAESRDHVFFYLKKGDKYVSMLSKNVFVLVTEGARTATRFREDDLALINNLNEFERERRTSSRRISIKIMRTQKRLTNGIVLVQKGANK